MQNLVTKLKDKRSMEENMKENGFNVVIRCQNKDRADTVKAEIWHKLYYDSDIVPYSQEPKLVDSQNRMLFLIICFEVLSLFFIIF